ncbi:unnamed protein product [Cladocopium goreaui]|uniref:peptidylprolyl isomerase n=1 Tax=Cladocopium goreaui TaxID=2562237 RepID=A0A9P1FU58_9DINO|nr:unnamed protein product [Cladocopium goreaui]
MSDPVAAPADDVAGRKSTDSSASIPRPKEPEEMTAEERSAFAEKCKGIGNRGFQAGDWDYAVVAYQEGIRYLEFVAHDQQMQPLPSDHGGAQRLEKDMALAVTIFSNLAATMLKMDEPSEALGYAEKALRFDPKHVKSLFRMGQAHLALGNFDAVHLTAKELEEQEQEEAAKLIKMAEHGAAVAKRKQKALFTKMMSS